MQVATLRSANSSSWGVRETFILCALLDPLLSDNPLSLFRRITPRTGPRWRQVLFVLVAYRLLSPGSRVAVVPISIPAKPQAFDRAVRTVVSPTSQIGL